MENNISVPTMSADPKGICETCAEPYVGMPIYLDDSFFKFISEDIELDCMPEGDMLPDNSPAAPDGGNNGGSGGNKPDMGIGRPGDCVMNCPLAMAYVPWQMWRETYELEKGFMAGTMFPCLDLPFLGGAAK